MPDDPQPPTAWLWAEIERRYGPAKAASLHAAFNAQMKAYQRAELLKEYRKEIAGLEQRIALAEQRGEGAALIRSLQRKIEHRRRRLEHGWPESHQRSSRMQPIDQEGINLETLATDQPKGGISRVKRRLALLITTGILSIPLISRSDPDADEARLLEEPVATPTPTQTMGDFLDRKKRAVEKVEQAGQVDQREQQDATD